MLLNNVTLINESRPVDITISGDKIMDIGPVINRMRLILFKFTLQAPLFFPGSSILMITWILIAFPFWDKENLSVIQNGEIIFTKYTRIDIDDILKIPQNLRTAWGIYKNLLAGITTVVNHGSYLKLENPLINIYQESQNLHSVKFEKNWKWKLNNPFLKNKDCVIHTGEGSDKQSSDEIDHC